MRGRISTTASRGGVATLICGESPVAIEEDYVVFGMKPKAGAARELSSGVLRIEVFMMFNNDDATYLNDPRRPRRSAHVHVNRSPIVALLAGGAAVRTDFQFLSGQTRAARPVARSLWPRDWRWESCTRISQRRVASNRLARQRRSSSPKSTGARVAILLLT
jgi:hypothetical protein